MGALYGDTNELMYSFSKKREIIQLNPQMKDFVLRHEELNYYELAKFLDKVNSKDKIESIVKDSKGWIGISDNLFFCSYELLF